MIMAEACWLNNIKIVKLVTVDVTVHPQFMLYIL